MSSGDFVQHAWTSPKSFGIVVSPQWQRRLSSARHVKDGHLFTGLNFDQSKCTDKIILQNLGPQHIELILEFSLWVLLQSPEEGLAIFTEDMDTVEALPRGQVN